MNILLTGGRGFLGFHLMDGLKNHQVWTLGRHSDDTIRADISNEIPALPASDLVIHAAGKAHMVPRNEQEAKLFWDINLTGTRKLAESLASSHALPKTFIFISSVAVYGVESGCEIEEVHPLIGNTPYAASKIEAEKWLVDWAAVHGINLVVLRLPLIVGKNAPGNLGAMVKNIRRGTYARIGSGEARRSMVLASDIAAFIPKLTGQTGIFNLTDGVHPSFAMLEDHIAAGFGKKIRTIPPRVASVMARIGDLIPGSPFNSYRYSKIRQSLTFSHKKAVDELGWKPTPVLNGFIP